MAANGNLGPGTRVNKCCCGAVKDAQLGGQGGTPTPEAREQQEGTPCPSASPSPAGPESPPCPTCPVQCHCRVTLGWGWGNSSAGVGGVLQHSSPPRPGVGCSWTLGLGQALFSCGHPSSPNAEGGGPGKQHVEKCGHPRDWECTACVCVHAKAPSRGWVAATSASFTRERTLLPTPRGTAYTGQRAHPLTAGLTDR